MAQTKQKEDPARNLALNSLKADVRDWREVRKTLDENKDEIKSFENLAKDEGVLRKRIGESAAELGMLDDGKARLDVDGKVTLYEMGSRAGGTDWKGSWEKLYATADKKLREKMDAALTEKDPIVLHKLISQ